MRAHITFKFSIDVSLREMLLSLLAWFRSLSGA